MSVASLIRQGLSSTPSDLVRQGLGSGAAPPAAISAIITLGLKYAPSDMVRLGLGATGGSAAVLISSATQAPLSGTTHTVGCTTDTASGTLYALARIGGSAAADSTIIATGQSIAVSSTSPSLTYSGLLPATTYVWDLVQVVAAVNSNVLSVSGTTDNTGDGGGDIAVDLALADTLHGHTAENVTLTTGGVLVVADSSHGHTADGVALSVTAALAVADALHAHTAENVTLTTGDVMVIADALHGHTADGVALSVTAVLVLADTLHAHTAENVTLTTGDVFVIADALHGHTADGVVLTLGDIALVIADALHAHRADNIRLGGRLTTIAEIVPYLLNGLVDGRVWESATPDDLPRLDGRILPFVVWTLHGGADAEYVEQFPAPSHSNARIQVHVAAPGGIVAERLMKDVRDALLASEYTVGVYGSPVGTYDPARKLKGRRQQFSVWFQQ